MVVQGGDVISSFFATQIFTTTCCFSTFPAFLCFSFHSHSFLRPSRKVRLNQFASHPTNSLPEVAGGGNVFSAFQPVACYNKAASQTCGKMQVRRTASFLLAIITPLYSHFVIAKPLPQQPLRHQTIISLRLWSSEGCLIVAGGAGGCPCCGFHRVWGHLPAFYFSPTVQRPTSTFLPFSLFPSCFL